MKQGTAPFGPGLKVWVESRRTGTGVFGDGKWQLLDALLHEESLSAASRALHISYRKAWGDLRKAEAGLGIALQVKQRGGSGGGTTTLTTAGKRLHAAYAAFRAEVGDAIEAAWDRHLKDFP